MHELERRAPTQRHMDISDILSMFLQICEGIKAFHEAKPEPLAHRDLKTANILLDNMNNPIIMDLGNPHFLPIMKFYLILLQLLYN